MQRGKRTGRKRYRGSVLTAALLWGCAALAGAAVVLAAANNIFEDHSWQAVLLRRENTALQAQALALDWFRSGVTSGNLVSAAEFELSSQPKDSPFINLPPSVLEELKNLNKNETIDVSIIDQHYSINFLNSAGGAPVPFGRPSEIHILTGKEVTDTYRVKRYMLRSRVSSKEHQNRDLILSMNLLALMDVRGICNIIILYTEKQ